VECRHHRGHGTDAGNIGTLHGPGVFREMELMQRAGLTPLQVLRSATVNGAATMALSDLGSVAAASLPTWWCWMPTRSWMSRT